MVTGYEVETHNNIRRIAEGVSNIGEAITTIGDTIGVAQESLEAIAGHARTIAESTDRLVDEVAEISKWVRNRGWA